MEKLLNSIDIAKNVIERQLINKLQYQSIDFQVNFRYAMTILYR